MAKISQKRKKLRHRRHQAEFNTLRVAAGILSSSSSIPNHKLHMAPEPK